MTEVSPSDVIFRNVTLPDGRSIGTARVVVRNGRVGVWRQRQGLIERAYVGDAVTVESTVGGFQVPKDRQQLAVTVEGGAVLTGRGGGCNCGTLPYFVIPDVF